jgi:hypothetical protein
MRQIFMSYTKEDEAFALRLADDLVTSGANVWIDIRNAKPGRHWNRSIEQALGDSHMMIVVLSPAALTSPHVAVEWQAYMEAYRPVIPVLAEVCDPPGPLRTRRPVDFTKPRHYTRAFHQLMNRLIEYGSRIRRNDPVIWTLVEDINDFRDERTPSGQWGVSLPIEPHAGQDRAKSPLRGLVLNLRDMLRRSAP